MSAAIWQRLARNELASVAVTFATTVIGRCSRAQGAELTRRRCANQRAAQCANTGAQHLCLAVEPVQPARGALARGLDALQALLAALADRDLTWPLPSTARRMA